MPQKHWLSKMRGKGQIINGWKVLEGITPAYAGKRNGPA